MRTSALASGIVAGLAGGVLLGLALTVVVPTHPGVPPASLMELLARWVGASALAGWIVVLATGAVLGGIYGLLVRSRRTPERAAVVAFFYALALAGLEALLVVPPLAGSAPLLGLANPALWPLGIFALGVNLLFASVVAGVFLALRPREPRRDARAAPSRTYHRAA